MIILMDQSISKWAISHCMFVHVVILEVRHHVCKSRLSCRFGSLFLDFVHLFQVLLGSWVQLWAKSFLCLERASFRFRYLVYFKSTSHSWMHHDLSWSLNLLETIQGDVIQVTSTVEISLFISHNLLEETITSCLSLLFLQQ